MAALSRIVEGQTLFTVTREKMGNTTITRNAVHAVRVISVDREARKVVASWNGNPARTFYEAQFSKWKVKRPVADPLFPRSMPSASKESMPVTPSESASPGLSTAVDAIQTVPIKELRLGNSFVFVDGDETIFHKTTPGTYRKSNAGVGEHSVLHVKDPDALVRRVEERR
jgi:hypothetical protein